ncbi:MAG TPA: MerR family transcriptional regulator [Mycobacteriales bacterium]|nr:MerR family transcriptional regulator [Mycobacteriales bacterium]
MTAASGGGNSSAGGVDWPITLEELADLVGMTARNIRAHQSRGLLPPPERNGRLAFYGPSHEHALRRIQELQERGYNLAAISALLAQDGDDRTALARLVLAPLLESDEIELTREQLTSMFDVQRDTERLAAALETGLLVELGDDRYLMPSRHVLEAARDLTQVGMPVLSLYDMQLAVTTATQDLARRFVETCLDCALEPYDGAPPPDRWDEVRERFDRLQRLTASVLIATFAMNVRRATEALLAERDQRAERDSG